MVECWDEVPDRRPRFASFVQKFQELLDEGKVRRYMVRILMNNCSFIEGRVSRGFASRVVTGYFSEAHLARTYKFLETFSRNLLALNWNCSGTVCFRTVFIHIRM